MKKTILLALLLTSTQAFAIEPQDVNCEVLADYCGLNLNDPCYELSGAQTHDDIITTYNFFCAEREPRESNFKLPAPILSLLLDESGDD